MPKTDCETPETTEIASTRTNIKTVYSWAGLVVLVLGLYGGGIAAWSSACKEIDAGKVVDKQMAKEIRRIDIKHTEKMKELMVLGTDVARKTQNTVASQAETLDWLKKTMGQMNSKLDRVLESRN